MELMFRLLVRLDRWTGRIVWGTSRRATRYRLIYSPTTLAGALNDTVTTGRDVSQLFSDGSGFFYWEHWS
jgi:hypothetical protein